MGKVKVYFIGNIPQWMPSPIIRVFVPLVSLMMTIFFPLIILIENYHHLIHMWEQAFRVAFFKHDKTKPGSLKTKTERSE